jgi:hypothetical protein
MADETFQQFIERWIGRYGTAQALSDAIGMSLSAFSRGVRNAGTLGLESCLRLAEVTGEPPSRVLRIAGKGEAAALIDRLYGGALVSEKTSLSALERELVTLWNGLSIDAQEPFLIILRALSEKQRKRRSA